MSRECDIAWAAGLFEGEGSIAPMRQKRRRRFSLIMQLGSADPDVVARFLAIVAVGNVTIRDRPNPLHKRMWVWQTAAIDDVRHVSRLLAPWLGARRTGRIFELLAEYDSQPASRKSKVAA